MPRKKDLHGSYSYYVNHKCRCEKCRMAKRDYQRDLRERKRLASTAEKEIATVEASEETLNG